MRIWSIWKTDSREHAVFWYIWYMVFIAGLFHVSYAEGFCSTATDWCSQQMNNDFASPSLLRSSTSSTATIILEKVQFTTAMEQDNPVASASIRTFSQWLPVYSRHHLTRHCSNFLFSKSNINNLHTDLNECGKQSAASTTPSSNKCSSSYLALVLNNIPLLVYSHF